MATITITDQSLLRLMQLSSASLPVGGYSFSQGLEYAIEEGWVKNSSELEDWLTLVMNTSLLAVDLPLLKRCFNALENDDPQAFALWNATVLASRETSELLLTETAMGEALVRLLNTFEIEQPALKQSMTFIAGFAVAAKAWSVNVQAMQVGYLWSWLENQIAAATKLVPLGQSQAQVLLVQLSEKVEPLIDAAAQVEDHQIGASLPGLAMASSWHETQYSRLFRS